MRRTSAIVLLVSLAGCLQRGLPYPPPGATAAFVTCEPSQCGPDGVVATVTGVARPGALVVAENTNRVLPGGQPYSASAYASHSAVGAAGADGGAGDAGMPAGAYTIQLDPITVPGGDPIVSHHGDTLRVYQVFYDDENALQRSESVDVAVP